MNSLYVKNRFSDFDSDVFDLKFALQRPELKLLPEIDPDNPKSVFSLEMLKSETQCLKTRTVKRKSKRV